MSWIRDGRKVISAEAEHRANAVFALCIVYSNVVYRQLVRKKSKGKAIDFLAIYAEAKATGPAPSRVALKPDTIFSVWCDFREKAWRHFSNAVCSPCRYGCA